MTARFTKSGEVVLDGGERTAAKDDEMNILHWMDETVELDDGITFLEILVCLAPWAVAVSMIANFDFPAWFEAAAMTEDPSDVEMEAILSLEIRPSINVYREPEASSAEITTGWEPFGRMACVENGCDGKTELVGIDLTHPSRYSRVPVSIVRTASVDDIMTGGSSAPWNHEPVVKPSLDGSVSVFTVHPTVIDTILYGLVREIASVGTPETAARMLEGIVAMKTELVG